MANNYILIDGSYFIFYRYYALNVWWSHQTAMGGDPPPQEELPHSHAHGGSGQMGLPPEFIEKFKSTFVSKIHDIDKKLKLKNTIKYVGKDCRRSDIWRTALYPEYKGTRDSTTTFLGAPLFKMVYDEQLYEKAGVQQILSYPSLEADDCIALMTKHLYKTEPDAHIWIIASDMDYLQITNDRIHLYDLKFKNICDKSSGDPLEDLFCKIVAGDKSDNIPSVFKKCGIKTAQKYFKDRDLFAKKLAADKEAQEIYKLNTTLVDFNCIPTELVEGYSKLIKSYSIGQQKEIKKYIIRGDYILPYRPVEDIEMTI